MIKEFLCKKYVVWPCILIFLLLFCYFENNSITVSNYIVKSTKLPKQFNNFTIVHISDLHNKVFFKNNSTLIKKIKSQNPDMIVITGDLIDRRRYNEENAMLFINKAKDIAPIYYVTGNHEGWSHKFSSLEKKLKNSNVTVLRNQSVYYEKENEHIVISGIDDPSFNSTNSEESYKNPAIIKKELDMIKNINDKNKFKILLCHRPEVFDIYVEENIDLVFTGHAHGGQINIPFVGGLIAPNQGFFPKYYKGTYSKDNTVMVVSRGLGNSIAPLRIFNRPEIVVVKLNS